MLRWVNLTALSALALFLVACQAATPEQLFADANAALTNGDAQTAEIHVKNLLQQEPNNLPGRVLLAKVYFAKGDVAAAEQTLRVAISVGGNSAEVQGLLLQALFALNQPNALITQYEAGPKLSGSDEVAALVLVGASYAALGGVDKAEAAYKSALELEPGSPQAKSGLAGLYAQTGRAPEAMTLIGEVLAAPPKFTPALLLRGNIELDAGQASQAQATFEEVMALDNRSSPTYSLAQAQLIAAQLAQNKVADAAVNADALLAANPTNPAARFLKARVEFTQGDLAGAEARLEAVVNDFPSYAPGYRLLGTINAAQQQVGQAESYFRQALQHAPRDAEASLALADLYIRNGRADEARAVIEGAAGPAGATNGVFLALAARASQQAGQSQLADEFFDKAEAAQPTDLQQLLNVSRVFAATGEFERAIRTLEGASFDDQTSEQLRTYLLALIQLRNGNAAGAMAAANRLAEQMPNSAWAFNLRGNVATLTRDFVTAEQSLAKSLELEPENMEALMSFARLAWVRSDESQVESYLKRALAKDPQELKALYPLSQIERGRGNFTEAAALLAKAPESALRALLQGDLLAAQDKFVDAATAYSRSYELEASLAAAVRGLNAATRAGQPQPEKNLIAWSAAHPADVQANFALGSLALSKGDQAEGTRRFEAVIEAQPNHAFALNNLAWLYNERGDARALELANRALELQPSNPEILDTVGWLHVQGGRAADGLPHLATAAAALNNPEVHYHWAVALADTGDTKTARDVISKVLEGNSDFPSRAAAQQFLAGLAN